MDEFMQELAKDIVKDAEENMAWICSIDTKTEISDTNPLTGKPLGEPFSLCDFEDCEEDTI